MSGIPPGWRWVALRDAGTWFGGGTPSKARREFWADGTVPWLSPKDMGTDVIASTRDTITESALDQSAARLVPPQSVAIVVRSGILERTVPVALVPFATALNQDMKALVPRGDIDPRWIAWGLRSLERLVLTRCRKAGTTVASLDTRRLLDVQLPVPPLEVQRCIVDILEDHLSRLDAACSGLVAGVSRAERLVTSARNVLWADSFEVGRICTVAEIGKVVTGSTPSTRAGEVFSGDVPFLTPSDVGHGSEVRCWGRTLNARGAASVRSLPEGAVLAVCIGATLGKVGWISRSSATNQQINALVVDAGAAIPAFLAAIMASPPFQAQMKAAASSTTLPILNKSKFSQLTLPFPPVSVQRELMVRLDAISEASSLLTVELGRSHRRAESLKRGLLAAAFSGRLAGRSSDVDRVEELAGV